MLAALCATLTVLLGGALSPAHAADRGYRYWSFWERPDGEKWSYATQGPATLRPEDGDVLGFRFALSEDSGSAAKPRGEADFAAVCDGTQGKQGHKRVAVRIDFGTAKDAPRGEKPPEARSGCALVEEDATAADALAATAEPLRYSSDALLCAVEGYPERGCGEQVSGKEDDGRASETRKRDGSEADGGGLPTGVGVGIGVAAVALLGAGAAWQARRRR
ncbi:hypothetical protein HCC30_23070 [Streptomyces sp. HNM0574]|nr:hypothetical protein [Streptomyces sp. HNM0574]